MAESPSPLIRIFLLGRWEVQLGEHRLPAVAWSRRKAAGLLQALALHKRLLKDQALDLFWPDYAPSAASNNLYRTLYALRATLDEAFGAGAAGHFFSFREGILVLADRVWVDVDSFRTLAQSGAPGDLAQAVELYRGELLPDQRYDEWTVRPREELARLFRQASMGLASHRQAQADFEAALNLLSPLLASDPTDEPVQRALIQLYALAGRRHEALRQYQACVKVLAEELGVPPDAETETLHRQILDGTLQPLPTATRALSPLSPSVPAVGLWVGRDLELQTLQNELASVWQGTGTILLVAGETGMGKSRLAQELLRRAEQDGMTALAGAVYEQEGRLPYQPFIEAINRFLARRGQPLSRNPITHFQPAGHSDPQQEQWALLTRVAAFLQGLAGQTPLLLFVDDLHAADESSLRLFHFLARQSQQQPLVLLATYRTDVRISPISPFGALLHSLYREGLRTVVHLGPLERESVALLAEQHLGGAVAPELVAALYERSEGNPFFVEELLRSLEQQNALQLRNGIWEIRPGTALRPPMGLQELLRARVAQLGEGVLATLEMAAVAGREFALALLAPISPQPTLALLDNLDTALGAHVLEETATGYCFRHGLIRYALYNGQSHRRLAYLHGQCAAALEALYSHSKDGLVPYVETLAYHFLHSDRPEQALPYLWQAGQKAAGLYAFEAAVEAFEQALALMDQMGMDDPARRWPVLEALGWWEIILADTPRAVARFEQALVLPATETWQPGRLEQVRARRGAAVALITAGEMDAAEAHLNAALGLISPEDDAVDYALLLYNIAQLHWHRNAYHDAFQVAQRSLEIAERTNDTGTIARAFEMLALACHATGDWQAGLLFEERRAALAGPALDVSEAFDVHL